VPTDNNPHYFKVKVKKTPNLPWEEFPPEPGCPGGNGRISLIFVSSYQIFSYHIISFLMFPINIIPGSSTIMGNILPYRGTSHAAIV